MDYMFRKATGSDICIEQAEIVQKPFFKSGILDADVLAYAVIFVSVEKKGSDTSFHIYEKDDTSRSLNGRDVELNQP